MKMNIVFAKTGLTLLSLVASSAAMRPAFSAPAKENAKPALSGTFRQITHATSGTASLSKSGARRTLNLRNFQTGMGPKLRVYLVSGQTTSNTLIKAAIKGKHFVDLGALQNIKGNQSYVVPSNSKADKSTSVVVWCDKFDVAFGVAPLS